jgi:hypothetical protein
MEKPEKTQGATPPAQNPAKTTPDEGKTFDRDMEFECVQDCYQDQIRYRQGSVITGRKCPPHFRVKGTVPRPGAEGTDAE